MPMRPSHSPWPLRLILAAIVAVPAGLAIGVFWFVWSVRAEQAARTYPYLDCSFLTWDDPDQPDLPPPFQIVPRGAFERAYIYMDGWNPGLSVMPGDGTMTYMAGDNDKGAMDIRLQASGEMTLDWRKDPGTQTVQARGTGFCSPRPAP